MEHYLSRALIGRIKCPRYYFLNVPEKRFRADRGGKGGKEGEGLCCAFRDEKLVFVML